MRVTVALPMRRATTTPPPRTRQAATSPAEWPDCVAMARALINEPDFVNRMKNEGEERCACTHANYCIARMYSIEMACHKHLHDLPCPVRREVERLDREAWQ